MKNTSKLKLLRSFLEKTKEIPRSPLGFLRFVGNMTKEIPRSVAGMIWTLWIIALVPLLVFKHYYEINLLYSIFYVIAFWLMVLLLVVLDAVFDAGYRCRKLLSQLKRPVEKSISSMGNFFQQYFWMIVFFLPFCALTILVHFFDSRLVIILPFVVYFVIIIGAHLLLPHLTNLREHQKSLGTIDLFGTMFPFVLCAVGFNIQNMFLDDGPIATWWTFIGVMGMIFSLRAGQAFQSICQKELLPMPHQSEIS